MFNSDYDVYIYRGNGDLAFKHRVPALTYKSAIKAARTWMLSKNRSEHLFTYVAREVEPVDVI